MCVLAQSTLLYKQQQDKPPLRLSVLFCERRSIMSDSASPCTTQFKEFSRPEYCSGSLSLLQGIFPTQDRTQVSHTAGGFFTSWATREAWCSGNEEIPPPCGHVFENSTWTSSDGHLLLRRPVGLYKWLLPLRSVLGYIWFIRLCTCK